MFRSWIQLTVPAVVVAGLAACASSNPPDAPPTTAPAATASPSATVPPETIAAPATDACRADQLTLAAAGSEGAAGTTYSTYRLTNSGAGTCTLQGYPGVSYLDSAGHEVQRNAAREPDQPTPLVRLVPGQAAAFVVANSNVVEGCSGPHDAVTLRVYPPDNTAAVTLAGDYRVCDPRVRPVTAAG